MAVYKGIFADELWEDFVLNKAHPFQFSIVSFKHVGED